MNVDDKPNDRFIYDKKTSNLYAPDGSFLKKVSCPKASRWNQLIVEEEADRWRGCDHCRERVINLDIADPESVKAICDDIFKRDTCIYASSSSGRVIFLKDDAAPPPSQNPNYSDDDLLIIYTARNVDDINRAVGLGYWPDLRVIEYDTENIRTKSSIGQNSVSGRIEISGDYRRRFRQSSIVDKDDDADSGRWEEAIPFFNYYENYQPIPIAAYLIPNGLSDGTNVIVDDPIEDIVGCTWSQGSAYRRHRVKARIENRKIVLDTSDVEVLQVLG